MIVKILRFTANWCAPCKQLAKTLNDFFKIPIEIIDVDNNAEYVEKYSIKSVPVLLFLDKDGNVLDRLNGAVPLNKIEETISKHKL
jgi:thioredoxin 1